MFYLFVLCFFVCVFVLSFCLICAYLFYLHFLFFICAFLFLLRFIFFLFAVSFLLVFEPSGPPSSAHRVCRCHAPGIYMIAWFIAACSFQLMLVGVHHYSWYCCCTSIHHPMSIDNVCRKVESYQYISGKPILWGVKMRQQNLSQRYVNLKNRNTLLKTNRQTATNITLAEVMGIWTCGPWKRLKWRTSCLIMTSKHLNNIYRKIWKPLLLQLNFTALGDMAKYN